MTWHHFFVADAALQTHGVEESQNALVRGHQSQNCFVFLRCQVQKLRKSCRIAALLMLSRSKIEEVSQDSFVFKLADRSIGEIKLAQIRQMGRQIDRWIDRQTDTQINRQIDNYSYNCNYKHTTTTTTTTNTHILHYTTPTTLHYSNCTTQHYTTLITAHYANYTTILTTTATSIATTDAATTTTTLHYTTLQ